MADAGRQFSDEDKANVRSMFRQFRSQGVPRREARARAFAELDQRAQFVGPPAPTPEQEAAQQQAAQPQRLNAAATGASQGATMGFADEIYAKFKAAQDIGGDPEAEYVRARDAERQRAGALQEKHPYTYGAGQIAGGAASAAAGGAALGGAKLAGAGLAAAAGAGAIEGGVAGYGESEAETLGGQLTDVAVGAGVGAATGGVVHGGAGLARGALKKFSPGAAAREAGSEVAESAGELATIGHKKTVSAFADRGGEIERKISDTLGEEFQLSPAQLTGDPAAALAESATAQLPKTMRDAQAMGVKRLRQSSRYLDMMIDGVASNPDRLGRSDVGGEVVGAINRHITSLRDIRRKAGGEAYDRVADIMGDKAIDTSPAVKAIQGLIDELPSNAGATASKLRKTMDALTIEGASAAGFKKIRAEQSFWSGLASGGGTVLDDIDKGQARRIAAVTSGGIQESLEKFAAEGGGEGVDALRRANSLYAELSRNIEDAGTDTVARILKVGDGDAIDTITDKVLKGSPDQIGGVFRILNKTSPETAQQLRAQMIEDLLVKGGKPSRGSPIAAELGVDQLMPGKALSALVKAEPKIQAAFAGDTKALLAFRESVELLQRLSQGPGLKGSQTTPLGAQMMQGAADVGVPGARMTAASWRWLKGVIGNDKAKARAMSSPEGVAAFRDGLRAATGKGPRLSVDAEQVIRSTMTRLGVDAAIEEGETDAAAQRNMANIQAARGGR